MELLGVKQQLKSTFDQIPDSGKTGYIWFVREHDEDNPVINPKHEIYINSRKYGDIVPPMVEVTYAELVTLVNDARLVPGQEYRITDFVTTVNSSLNDPDTGITSAGHVFDIIVTADDEITLNENVRFALHEGDTYFANSNLDAWEGKYTIENDRTKFAWAEDSGGTGVIYYLKDEFRNECPYDFKNILYNKVTISGQNRTNVYTFFALDNNVVIDTTVMQLLGSYNIHDNVIKPLFINNIMTPNRNVFAGSNNYGNILQLNCRNNVFDTCYNCTFGESCYGNSLGVGSYNNNFSDNCYNNSFANNCYNNTLCTSVNNVVLANGGYYNFFASYCHNITGSIDIQCNTFEEDCHHLNFKDTHGYYVRVKHCIFGNGVANLNFMTNDYVNGHTFQYLQVFNGYGRAFNSMQDIPAGIATNVNYAQAVGIQSDGTFKVKNLLDDELTAGTSIDITNGVISAIDMIEIEYADLVTLRNSSGLTPGMQYRITDYITEVADGIGIAILGFGFDIIVFADDDHTLNENVRFAQHEGVSYFSGCNMELWEGKYTIDNDTTLYPWVSASGYGVIYYLKDEFRNECSYDFKSIVFNNIDYSGTTLQGVFTFSIVNNGVATDSTLNNGNYVHDNIIKPLITYQYQNSITQHQLNKNIFFGANTYNNTLGLNSSGNTFYSVYNCTFGESCTGNVLNSGSNSINFEDFCINNTLGSNCFSNTLGTGCVNNSLGNGCDHNFLGHGCTDNVLNGSCSYNYFKNNCCYNTFNLSCRRNSFGNACGNNTFRDNCVDNTFGNNCTNILTSSNSGNVSLQACTFGDGVHYLDFTTNYAGQTIQYLDVFEGYGYSASTAVPSGILTGVTYTQSIGFQSDGTFKVKNLLDDPYYTPIQYSALVTLRNNSQLIPGMQYRITDYVTTVANVTDASSAGHVFDIIVTADDESTLNENVRFIQHDGDTYFSDCNLAAWEGQYCLDNDTDRFLWADTTNGKGVIYYLKDEFGNECGYDFKNVLYENVPYSNPLTLDSAYTFNFLSGNLQAIDSSLSTSNGATYGNIVKPYFINGTETISGVTVTYLRRQLNCNVFIINASYTFCNNNELDTDCHDNRFYAGASGNTIGCSCYGNLFGEHSQNNVLGDNCYNNTIGSEFDNNKMGSFCHDNTFGTHCSGNVIENEFQENVLGGNCDNNFIYSSFKNNTLGQICSNNVFNPQCVGNSFGDNIQNNTFSCKYTKIQNSSSIIYQNINVLHGVQGTSISNQLSLNTDDFSNTLQSNANFVQYIGRTTSGQLKIFNPAD